MAEWEDMGEDDEPTVVDRAPPGAMITDDSTVVDSQPGAEDVQWDEQTDVVVVGFGGAGACAALAAAEHRVDVTVLERFGGGGSTRMSGGVVYIGGGTAYQVNAGFGDSPENMFRYLDMETQGVVSKRTLRQFCDQSPAMLTWLERQGVPFGSDFCPFKTSYPISKYYLYFSGNESFPPYCGAAKPAPRGHRTRGKGMPGGALFNALKRAVFNRGISVRRRARVRRLITNQRGEVTGVGYTALKGLRVLSTLHLLLDQLAYHARYVIIQMPFLARVFTKLFDWIESAGEEVRIRARRGVILAAGGFIHNREMVATLAPDYSVGSPLGCLGDDGSGIELGQSVGGETALMDRVSAWRFINPPAAFVSGVIVDREGRRISNEQVYGALLSEKMVAEHGGEAFLIIDEDLFWRAHRDLEPSKATWFQIIPALVNLWLNRKKGRTMEELAERCGIPLDNLRRTIDAYNRAAATGGPDSTGKAADVIKPLAPPYYAIDCSLGSKLFACATLTLGGLMVSEETGEVERNDGSVIPGLYAVGRTAVGVTSRGYVSGLSIADAVFSGRRAGRHAAMHLVKNRG